MAYGNLATIFKGLNTAKNGRTDYQKLAAIAMLCAVMPLETSHLLAALAGAALYFGWHVLQPSVARSQPKRTKVASTPVILHKATKKEMDTKTRARTPAVVATTAPKPTMVPVLAPTFQSKEFELEVQELLGQISSTHASDALVLQIARRVQKAMWGILPEAEVAGYASGNVFSGAAFGVAVPEVDIVISVSPHAMAKRLQGRVAQDANSSSRLDVRKLQKSAIRACTDRLVATGKFKFRRSAFRGDEPRVTLIAQDVSDDASVNVPINISVNSATPMYSEALITECGQKDPRAKALILLVRRWAKDRGISHEAKGHLSPYVWSLLAIYFLQVEGGDDGPILPALDDFEVSSGLMQRRRREKDEAQSRFVQPISTGGQSSVASLFKKFVNFYAKEFDWCNEGISARLGCRASPDTAVPLHIMLHDDGNGKDVGPSIEDPFKAACNLGVCMTSASLARLHEEFDRAHKCIAREDSLSLLLEPWSPPVDSNASGMYEAREN